MAHFSLQPVFPVVCFRSHNFTQRGLISGSASAMKSQESKSGAFKTRLRSLTPITSSKESNGKVGMYEDRAAANASPVELFWEKTLQPYFSIAALFTTFEANSGLTPRNKSQTSHVNVRMQVCPHILMYSIQMSGSPYK